MRLWCLPFFSKPASTSWSIGYWLSMFPSLLQLSRAMQRDGQSKEQILAIIRTQLDTEDRLRRADDRVDNSTDLPGLHARLERLHGSYMAMATRAMPLSPQKMIVHRMPPTGTCRSPWASLFFSARFLDAFCPFVSACKTSLTLAGYREQDSRIHDGPLTFSNRLEMLGEGLPVMTYLMDGPVICDRRHQKKNKGKSPGKSQDPVLPLSSLYVICPAVGCAGCFVRCWLDWLPSKTAQEAAGCRGAGLCFAR